MPLEANDELLYDSTRFHVNMGREVLESTPVGHNGARGSAYRDRPSGHRILLREIRSAARAGPRWRSRLTGVLMCDSGAANGLHAHPRALVLLGARNACPVPCFTPRPSTFKPKLAR